jgi:hypothetical protein
MNVFRSRRKTDIDERLDPPEIVIVISPFDDWHIKGIKQRTKNFFIERHYCLVYVERNETAYIVRVIASAELFIKVKAV